MMIYIVMEYGEYTNNIIGVFKNLNDAEKEHGKQPTTRYIKECELK